MAKLASDCVSTEKSDNNAKIVRPQRTVLHRSISFNDLQPRHLSFISPHNPSKPENCDENKTGPINNSAPTPPLHLRLMFLSCEENPPYGPAPHTAQIFLDLFFEARCQYWNISRDVNNNIMQKQHDENLPTTDTSTTTMSVSLSIYDCKNFDYPKTAEEWDSYHGIILPGSFSSAYASDDWILELKRVIRQDVFGKKRSTLAVCFGHQIYAHSLDDAYYKDMVNSSIENYNDNGTMGETMKTEGRQRTEPAAESSSNAASIALDVGGLASRCPAGIQFGRRGFVPTMSGKDFLLGNVVQNGDANVPSSSLVREEHGESMIHMLYTHSDMVERLPPCAVSLGGTPTVPIQAAAYFASAKETSRYQQQLSLLKSGQQDVSKEEDEDKANDSNREGRSLLLPHAFTFQAHPEFACAQKGVGDTFTNILQHIKEEFDITKSTIDDCQQDVTRYKDLILADSIKVAVSVGKILGWV